MNSADPNGARAPAIVVDARGLEPPEPMERVLSALDDLPPGEKLLMRIHIEPRPLFRVSSATTSPITASTRPKVISKS